MNGCLKILIKISEELIAKLTEQSEKFRELRGGFLGNIIALAVKQLDENKEDYVDKIADIMKTVDR